MLAWLLACTPEPGPVETEAQFPDPADWTREGPGAPAVSFAADAVWQPCAYIVGDERDHEHHNLSVMHDGWLVHPWAPEDGGGGVSFWDVSDPCAPVLHGLGYSPMMRETHTLAFGEAGGREYLAVDYLSETEADVGGVGFFDITDRSAPVWVSELATPGFHYPDSYLRVTFSNFWQGDILYVAGAGNGVLIVDVSDPLAPVLVNQVQFTPPHVVGQVTVVGNLAVVASAGTARVVLMDVSDPVDPQPIPGGDFDMTVGGEVLNYYFSSVSGKYGLFARNDDGGGPIVVDLTDPTSPDVVGHTITPDGDGGYVYRNGNRVFQGDSEFGVVWDFSDPTAPVELQRLDVRGDVDTMSPIGNVVLVSVDSGGDPGQATTIFPWDAEPDTRPPVLELVNPAQGAVTRSTARIGLSFDEWIERKSVHAGSFRVTGPFGVAVPGGFNVQEAIANFTPDAPLLPGRYTVTVPAGGIADISGNPVSETTRFTFEVR
ncbi:MAG: Ig-like domain-containing protein [Myxococcota bacterium]